MNAAAALRGNALYIYGGLVEPEDASELTLSDLWSVDVAKLDGWSCLYEGEAIETSLAKEEDDDDDDDEDEGEESQEDDSESDESDDDESDDDDEEGEATKGKGKAKASASSVASAGGSSTQQEPPELL